MVLVLFNKGEIMETQNKKGPQKNGNVILRVNINKGGKHWLNLCMDFYFRKVDFKQANAW